MRTYKENLAALKSPVFHTLDELRYLVYTTNLTQHLKNSLQLSSAMKRLMSHFHSLAENDGRKRTNMRNMRHHIKACSDAHSCDRHRQWWNPSTSFAPPWRGPYKAPTAPASAVYTSTPLKACRRRCDLHWQLMKYFFWHRIGRSLPWCKMPCSSSRTVHFMFSMQYEENI